MTDTDLPERLAAAIRAEEVARLICPEAFRARDQFQQAMQRLTTSAGLSSDEIDGLKEELLYLARTTSLSVTAAVDHVVAVAEAQHLLASSDLSAPSAEG